MSAWQMKLVYQSANTIYSEYSMDCWSHTYTPVETCFAQGHLISHGGFISSLQFVRTEPATFSCPGQTAQRLCVMRGEFCLRQSVLMRELITGQIFVKGDCALPFPFDWKGELSALNVEPRNGKWVSYLFQIVDLSWVKWKSFMFGGRKRPKRGKKSVRPKFHWNLFNYFSVPVAFFFFPPDMKVSEWQKLYLHLKRYQWKRLTFKGDEVGLGDYKTCAYKPCLNANTLTWIRTCVVHQC